MHAEDNIIAFDGVVRRFGQTTAVEDLTFTVGGGITALLGLNGAGKTTAIRMLLGLITPDHGEIRCLGHRPGHATVRENMAAVLQKAGLPDDLTVAELLSLFGRYYAQAWPTGEIADRLELGPWLNRRYGQLSGGQQRWVQFAIALVGDPQVLVLDEPTTGLDPDARSAFWAHLIVLAEQGRTVLVTTHYLEEADRVADRVLLIHRGRLIADDDPSGLKQRAAAKRIRCRTTLDNEALRGLPALVETNRDGTYADLRTLDAEATLRSLFERDADVRDLTVTGGDLESAIRTLTATQGDQS